MSRILIVTAFYHPFIHPRAHRWTALAENWAAQGHEIQVVTARHRGFPGSATEQGVTIHRQGFDSPKELFYYYAGSRRARGRVGAAVQKPGRLLNLFSWLYVQTWKRFRFPDDAGIWYVPAKKKTLQLLEGQSFDLMITVSMPFTGHLIGLAAKQRFPALRWLADIGDPFSMPERSGWYRRKSRQLERTVLEQADVVAVTTPATLELYRSEFGPDIVRNMIVIPPLLHPMPQTLEPSNTQTLKYLNTQTLSLGYFGALYAPLRTPDAFLDLLERSFTLRPALRERLKIHFYGDIFPEFYHRLHEQPAITLHGLRPREEVRRAMEQMDILLHLGNATAFQLPSKAVDYLGAGRPVVHLAYAENDAFVQFFGPDPNLLVLRVENDQVRPEDLDKWLEWLDAEKPVVPDNFQKSRLQAYGVAAIAAQYLAWQK